MKAEARYLLITAAKTANVKEILKHAFEQNYSSKLCPLKIWCNKLLLKILNYLINCFNTRTRNEGKKQLYFVKPKTT